MAQRVFVSKYEFKESNLYFIFQIACGNTFVQPNIRIVGGSKANAYSWPALVLIVLSYKGDFYVPLEGYQTISQQFIWYVVDVVKNFDNHMKIIIL